MDRQTFREKAKTVKATLDGIPVAIPVKEFSTGSFGWYANQKATLMVGDEMVTVQLGLNLTVVGSKKMASGSLATAGAAS